jgi:hypothetical protein
MIELENGLEPGSVESEPRSNLLFDAFSLREPVSTEPVIGRAFARPVGSKTLYYSIVTTRRPINLATSSRCSESCSATACASRTRHSSSLKAGMSLGTIDGTGLRRTVWVSGMESPLKKPGAWPNFIGKSVFLALGSWRESAAGSRFPDRCSCRKPMWRQGYPANMDAAARRPIWPFATPGGFVIRCRVRTIGFAYSSVAQR